MASKTYNVAGGGTATVTTNSDGSRSISFSNNVGGGYGGSTVTGSAGCTSVTKTNSNGSTQTGTISGSGRGTSVSWDNNTGGDNNNNNNNTSNNQGREPVTEMDFSKEKFGLGTSYADQASRNDRAGRFFAGQENVTTDTIRNALMQNSGFASASTADQQNTINRIMNLQNKYKNSGGGGIGNGLNKLGDKIQTPYLQQQLDNNYNGQFANIQNYISSLSGDLSGMRDLMEKNNTMFLSKLDAQMTQQKAMEEKFNTEWSRIEGQMDENTKAQKTRLDQMEQRYNENLQKMQDMLTDYYTGTMDALEAKAAGESAAAASDLSAKGLNSAVVVNTTAGLDKNYREQFNVLMKNNIELGQQLNNDYADFMNQLVNQHNTLDQNQIRTLTEGLQMKQQYRQQETDLVNSYIDNVYKPIENHISELSETYTDRANTAYKNERAVAEYKGMSTAARTRDIMNRLMAMVGDGNLEALSEQDLNLISKIAERSDINSTEEAIAVLLKAAQRSGNSDVINAVSTAQRKGTWNVNPGSTSNPGNTNNLGGNDTELEGNGGEENNPDNVNKNTISSENDGGNKLIYINPSTGEFVGKDALEKIKNLGDTALGKAQHTNDLLTVVNQDKQTIKSMMANAEKGSKEYTALNKILTQYDQLEKEAKNYKSWVLKRGEGFSTGIANLTGLSSKNLKIKVDGIVNNDNLTNIQKQKQLNDLKNQIQIEIKANPKLTTYNNIVKNIDNELASMGF